MEFQKYTEKYTRSLDIKLHAFPNFFLIIIVKKSSLPVMTTGSIGGTHHHGSFGPTTAHHYCPPCESAEALSSAPNG